LKSRARRRNRHPLFGQLRAQADFGYWAKAPHWTSDEAAALSLGYAPRIANSATVKPYFESSYEAEEFDRRSILIERAIKVNALKESFSPSEFITWANGRDLDLPEELRDAVAMIRASDNALQDEVDELRKQISLLKNELELVKKDPNPRQLRSLQIMVAAMASRKYHFNPSAERNSATKAIFDDIALLGLSIDKDTVLTHLRAAFREICDKLDP